jgi:hypothetical protein
MDVEPVLNVLHWRQQEGIAPATFPEAKRGTKRGTTGSFLRNLTGAWVSSCACKFFQIRFPSNS